MLAPFTMPDGDRAWADDPNLPRRFVVQRATNRFQAYQHHEGSYYSVGYFLTREDVRPFIAGAEVQLVSEWGEDTDAEPLVYPSSPIQ